MKWLLNESHKNLGYKSHLFSKSVGAKSVLLKICGCSCTHCIHANHGPAFKYNTDELIHLFLALQLTAGSHRYQENDAHLSWRVKCVDSWDSKQVIFGWFQASSWVAGLTRTTFTGHWLKRQELKIIRVLYDRSHTRTKGLREYSFKISTVDYY